MWVIQAAVVLAIPLSLGGAVWAGIRIIRWVKANPGDAASFALDLYLKDRVEGLRGWLGDWVDGGAEPASASSTACSEAVDGEGALEVGRELLDE